MDKRIFHSVNDWTRIELYDTDAIRVLELDANHVWDETAFAVFYRGDLRELGEALIRMADADAEANPTDHEFYRDEKGGA